MSPDISARIRSVTTAILKSAAPGACACCLLLAPASHAAVTISFEQVGDDTVVTSTGYLNFTGKDWTWSSWELADPYYRHMGGNLGAGQDIVRLYRTSVQAYDFDMAGNLFSKPLPLLVADEYSGMTFGIWTDIDEFSVFVPRHFQSGAIESSMTFRNLSLESLGVIEQVIDLGSTDDLRIIITTVPEPGSVALSATVLLGLACRRRRGEGK